jgi:hypothetical protein
MTRGRLRDNIAGGIHSSRIWNSNEGVGVAAKVFIRKNRCSE